MVALALAAFAVVIYAASGLVGLPNTVRLLAAASGLLALLSVIGLRITYRSPKLASYLIGGWTIVVLVVGATTVAVVAQLTASIKPLGGDSAPIDVRALIALTVAAFSALVEQSGALIKARTAPWLAKQTLCGRYDRLFPAQPAGPPQGLEAYRVVSNACHDDSLAPWSLQGRELMFQVVHDAIAIGAYKGGKNWDESEPAAGTRVR